MCVFVCAVLLISSGSGETGSVIRDQMSVRRRDAATLPSETLPVQMISTKVKGERGANQGPTCAAFRAYSGALQIQENIAPHCQELCR